MLTLDITLPSWKQCAEAHKAESASALQEFIYENEPAGDKDGVWRSMLVDMLVEAIEKGRRARPVPI